MRYITVDEWKHIQAETKVENGYPNGYCTAPSDPGYYTLYEVANDNNVHVGWHWEKEEES